MALETINVVTVEGLAELDDALAELPKATAKNVMLRVLKKRAQPIADSAKARAPFHIGILRKAIIVGTKAVGGNAGKIAFAETMEAGGTRAEAGAAAKSANQADPESGDARVFIGPIGTARKYASIQEFGTDTIRAHPYMRPAWDDGKQALLDGIANDLRDEIFKAAARLAKKAAKKAALG